jgi:hypothetical protein
MPEDALRAGLIDDVVYEDQVVDKLKANDAPDEARWTPRPTDVSA